MLPTWAMARTAPSLTPGVQSTGLALTSFGCGVCTAWAGALATNIVANRPSTAVVM